jgi:hypothetical protein
MPDPSLPRRTVASVDAAVIERAPRLASTAEQRGPEPEPSASPPTGLPGPGGPGPGD